MNKSTLALCGFLAASLSTHALAADRYRIDPDHTFAHFAVVHTGISSVQGRMGIIEGSATFDTEQQTAQVDVQLDPRSVDTGVKQLDAALIGELFFDVARFKTARFVGRAVKFSDGLPSAFDGDLTIHGVTRPVHLSAERFVCRQVKFMIFDRFVCGGDLQGILKRSDFKLDKYLSMVSDEVRITISVEAIRENK
jgi:polyisoprenoid-binding protein YceI